MSRWPHSIAIESAVEPSESSKLQSASEFSRINLFRIKICQKFSELKISFF